MGTATALELLNYFVQHPPQNTLIFLFNNFEEGGLVGAQSFIHHPWFASIKLFVNLGKRTPHLCIKHIRTRLFISKPFDVLF
jgi:hypothetical protein